MKVLMLNGSFNPDGSTSAGLEIMAKTFTEEGVETEIVTVGGKPIADCIACGKCAGLKRCVFANDAVNDFAEKAKTRADGYAAFHHKPVASIVVARRAGTSASFDVMNKYATISQMIVVGSSYWNEFHALTKDDVPQDPEGLQTLRNLARNMVYVMKCQKAGRDAGILPPANESGVFTNFVR